ncbi:MAG: helix-turn-helix transcriptional regulator [Parasporobacterium sp.]|nr:helix-turn-helix transcriptional regulator [Parasporobacterium sp.]
MAIFAHILGGEDFADINEDRSAERIGARIKKIRESREMSRSELGALVGLDQNRIQQYENGKRKPKIPLLKKIALALGVNAIALMDPTIDTYVGAMHTLFQMEEKLGLKIMEKDGYLCLQFGDGRMDGMNYYLRDWYKVRKELDEAMPNLSDEERKKKIFDYNMFEWTYPSGIAINASKKYNEHPINRMQEIKEDQDWLDEMRKELDERIAQMEQELDNKKD